MSLLLNINYLGCFSKLQYDQFQCRTANFLLFLVFVCICWFFFGWFFFFCRLSSLHIYGWHLEVAFSALYVPCRNNCGRFRGAELPRRLHKCSIWQRICFLCGALFDGPKAGDTYKSKRISSPILWSVREKKW